MTDLSGKRALITGSTSGIGFGIASGLAERGANIVLHGLGDPDMIAAQVASIGDKGVDCHFLEADLMDGQASQNLIHTAEADIGAVDIVVNNAGIQHVSPVVDFPDDKWDALIQIMLSSPFHTTKAALPYMTKRGFGRVINISSAHGLVASPFKSAYVAAKHGVIGFTKSAALEVAELEDVTINAICPGYVKTPLVEGQIADQAKSHGISEDAVVKDIILAVQPTKRFVELHELAALTALLSSSDGKSFNGSALVMDGGWTAR